MWGSKAALATPLEGSPDGGNTNEPSRACLQSLDNIWAVFGVVSCLVPFIFIGTTSIMRVAIARQAINRGVQCPNVPKDAAIDPLRIGHKAVAHHSIKGVGADPGVGCRLQTRQESCARRRQDPMACGGGHSHCLSRPDGRSQSRWDWRRR